MRKLTSTKIVISIFAAVALIAFAAAPVLAAKKPNIIIVMGDDIGIWNIGAYHRGMMAGRTPNIDKLAREGAIFTDYYTEASCTAGRANFITGELPIRVGLTTVGQAGATVGMPAAAPTIATDAPLRAAATAWFRPLPPACSAYVVPETVSPGPGRRAVVATRSRLTLPMTATSNTQLARARMPMGAMSRYPAA